MSVWTGLPAPRTCPGAGPCAGPVTLQAAAQITAAYTRPGDLVLAPDGSAAVIQAAATAGRHVLGLVPHPVRGTRLLAGLRACLDPAARPLARLRPGGPAALLAPGDPAAGQAALVITGCHAPGCPAAGEAGAPAAGLLYAACQRVLAPGGVLAVLLASPAAGGRLTGLPGQVTAAVRAAGLIYAQHIVLVHAAIHRGQLTPQPALPTGPAGSPDGRCIHSDLLIFTQPGGCP